MKTRWIREILALLLIGIVGCASPPPRQGSQSASISAIGAGTGPVSQAELQQDVQRYVSEFHETIVQALGPLLNSENPEIRDRALRQGLLYATSAIDIATGPSPEANLLDMIWFVRLNRMVIQDYWIPHLYGQAGQPLLEAFERLEDKAWGLASKVMDANAKQELIVLLDQWRAENPGQIRVEFIRFSEFSYLAGQASQARAQEVSGLLRSVQTGVVIADNALLLAERSLFLAQRMPFLLRLQVQIASRDIVSDLDKSADVKPLVSETTNLAVNMRQVASESRLLVETIANEILPAKEFRHPGYLLETVKSFQAAMASAERMLERTESLIHEAKLGKAGSFTAPLSVGLEETDRMVRRWVLYFLILGASWAVFGWGGYYLAHRGLKNGQDRHAREAHHSRR